MSTENVSNEEKGNGVLADVSNSLFYDKLAVVIKTKSGKIFQVALDQEMSDVLYSELKDFFKGGKEYMKKNNITEKDIEYMSWDLEK